jgi:hypothetical protein
VCNISEKGPKGQKGPKGHKGPKGQKGRKGLVWTKGLLDQNSLGIVCHAVIRYSKPLIRWVFSVLLVLYVLYVLFAMVSAGSRHSFT